MAMTRFWCVILWISVISELLLCRNVCASLCHREERFRKLEGPFPSDTPIKVTTKSTLTFCSIECLEVPGCKSIAFLTTTGTDNCHLGPNEDGLATPTEAEVYKLRNFPKTIRGCASSPCKNGGTCEDLCEQAPYYLCRCPADKQGYDCKWDISLSNVDWKLAFDDAGTHTCTGNTFLAGFKRSDGDQLNNIEEAVCGALQFEYSESSITCTNADWWNTFAKHSWSLCPNGYLLRGFMRQSGSQDLGYIEEGVCCKPPGSPVNWANCYHEDISVSFDEPWATASCQQPLHFIQAIKTSEGERLINIEELYCCKMASMN
ncbi:neurogenic locus Notch -like [Paramuricea clavata]|uniref:Neurogenic locus Notch -like n=1 Tax=Paramuricea clavata TaxID=317549 RepID=A0A7D9IHI8_PARCT|nr:neurogenic locus Notch -like [Paramuricea clavata]